MFYAIFSTLVITSAFADTACTPTVMMSGDSITLDLSNLESGIPLGGLTLHGIDPDEIDLANTCAPTVWVEGLELHGIDPDEIDNQVVPTLLDFTPQATGSALVGQTATGATVTAQPVFAVVDATIREEVISKRPYQSRVVMDLSLEIVDVQVAETGLAPTMLLIDSATTVTITPEKPVCSRCL